MTIQTGDRIPECVLSKMTEQGPEQVPTQDYFAGRKVVLFAVPGAFTPTCSAKHLPGFVDMADDFFAQGVDAIGCMAVNDVFVMGAWGQGAGADRIDMLADGNGEFTRALGLELDEVIATVTANPAKLIAMDDELGSLRVGATADISVLNLLSGQFRLSDNSGEEMIVDRWLHPEFCMVAGERHDADSPLVPPVAEAA